MIYLSIYLNEYECKEFLFNNGFLSREEMENEDYDLLGGFDCDPDYIDIQQPNGIYNRVYFAEFNPCNVYRGDSVCLTTAEYNEETEVIKRYIEGLGKYESYEPNTWDAIQNDFESCCKCAHRGGSGYIYHLSYYRP